jgi:hypothetical protein
MAFDPFSLGAAAIGGLTSFMGARDAAKEADAQRAAVLKQSQEQRLRAFDLTGLGGASASFDPLTGQASGSLGDLDPLRSLLVGQTGQFFGAGSSLPMSVAQTGVSALGSLADPFSGEGTQAANQLAMSLARDQLMSAGPQVGPAPTLQTVDAPDRVQVGVNQFGNRYFINPNTGQVSAEIDGSYRDISSPDKLREWYRPDGSGFSFTEGGRALLDDPSLGLADTNARNAELQAQFEQQQAAYQQAQQERAAYEAGIPDLLQQQFGSLLNQQPGQPAQQPGMANNFQQAASPGLAPQIEPTALNATTQGLSLLNIPPEVLGQNRLNVLREQAQPFEQRAFQDLQENLFSTGRIGTSGGGLQTEAFARGLAQADLDRQLSAEDQALRLRQSAIDQTGAGIAGLGEGRAQRGLFDTLATSGLNRTGFASDLSARRAFDRFNLANLTFDAQQKQIDDNLNRGLSALGGVTGLQGIFNQNLANALGIEQARAGQANAMTNAMIGAPQGGDALMGGALASFGGSLASAALPNIFGSGGGSTSPVGNAQQGAGYVAPTLAGSPGFNPLSGFGGDLFSVNSILGRS